MDLLFKREQRKTASKRVSFKLWSKIELDETETAIVSKYNFDQAILIFADQPGLLRSAIFFGLLGLLPGLLLAGLFDLKGPTALVVLLIPVIALSYWRYHQTRETIYVKDLLHGRNFSCGSVVELARKEAWLGVVVSFLRQVMESAKHWDGTERLPIEALPKDEARQVIIKGL